MDGGEGIGTVNTRVPHCDYLVIFQLRLDCTVSWRCIGWWYRYLEICTSLAVLKLVVCMYAQLLL
jgi:hypothetical protein